MKYQLRLTEAQHRALLKHLYPGDGLEATAFILCGRRDGDERHILLGREVHPVPYAQCRVREVNRVTWSTLDLPPLLEAASPPRYGILKVHSHPGGYGRFSDADNQSDREILGAALSWLDDGLPHGSAVMLPDGRMFGRVLDAQGVFTPFESVAVVGDDVIFWFADPAGALPDHAVRTAQAFGTGTTALLGRLSIAVVGCSGTGSLVIQALHGLGVGRLVLVDPDLMKIENLERIPQAIREDVEAGRKKVTVMEGAIARARLGSTTVVTLDLPIENPRATRTVAGCDLVVGCMDGAEGRDTLNRLATFYNLPYIDVGVRLDADGQGGVNQVLGAIHYLQPGGSSLRSRGIYVSDDVRAEHLRRTAPEAFARERKEGYIKGVREDHPAVISVNMQVAAMAVNEVLARLHPYRDDPNREYASYKVSLTQGCLYRAQDGEPCKILTGQVGRGDVEPLLDRPEE
jgi:hypothetical protein